MGKMPLLRGGIAAKRMRFCPETRQLGRKMDVLPAEPVPSGFCIRQTEMQELFFGIARAGMRDVTPGS